MVFQVYILTKINKKQEIPLPESLVFFTVFESGLSKPFFKFLSVYVHILAKSVEVGVEIVLRESSFLVGVVSSQ